MKKSWLIGGVLLVFALLVYRMNSARAPALPSLEKRSPKQETAWAPVDRLPPPVADLAATKEAPSVAPPLTARPDPATESLKQKPKIEEQIPKLEDVRKEVEADPHITPKSLIQFSVALGQKMELALQSESASQYLMPELAECAKGDSIKTTASTSALCLQNAFRLSDKFPKLKADAEKIQSSADPEAVRIYDGMKSLGI